MFKQTKIKKNCKFQKLKNANTYSFLFVSQNKNTTNKNFTSLFHHKSKKKYFNSSYNFVNCLNYLQMTQIKK